MTAPSPPHLTAPFAAVPVERAAALLARTHALAVDAVERLATERDDTFRVRSGDRMLVAKLAHPLDDPRVVADQLAVLEALARIRPDLPVPRVLPAADGALSATIQTVDGPRLLRVLTHLDGETLGSAPRSLGDLRALGALHARLARAIAAIGDAADPPLQGAPTEWNLLALERYGPLVPAIGDPALRSAIAAVIERAADAVLAPARALPAVLAHNDLHGDNVLVRPGPPGTPLEVTGVLDFGDMTRTARVADLAVAASYARGRVGEAGPPWAAATAYVAGYESVEPLDPAEHALLPDLVLLRLAQRGILNSAIAAANPRAAEYASRNLSAIARDLRELGASTPHRIGGTP
ncbi:phosphotransferase [Microcella frigidaquae]|uniref:Hydroxylysine kinase n=1 Tax=Microcella frigidaquae TaxID=424758 RepID=A0A840XP91_9MICO|nr:Ser/Thr protein kinase RdoA (MazF antagonist) [Microcella frigidaquae]NHN45546.1 phosphotransferase [Microcella frigidaquae]